VRPIFRGAVCVCLLMILTGQSVGRSKHQDRDFFINGSWIIKANEKETDARFPPPYVRNDKRLIGRRLIILKKRLWWSPNLMFFPNACLDPQFSWRNENSFRIRCRIPKATNGEEYFEYFGQGRTIERNGHIVGDITPHYNIVYISKSQTLIFDDMLNGVRLYLKKTN
jgi:hypothetical protein